MFPLLPAGSSRRTEHDIFLSHAFPDKAAVQVVRDQLVAAGYKVYVDWIEDHQLDRAMASAATADLLRDRLRRCGALVFCVSTNSPLSKWMPWELGFADALMGKVFVLPLDEGAVARAKGQEYLRLYPIVERADLRGFLDRHLRKFAQVGVREGELAMTAGNADRMIENMPRLMLDPALATQWYGDVWKAWWAMFGVRL